MLVSPEISISNKPNQGNGVPLVSVANNMANDFSVTNFQPTKQLDYFSQMLGFKVQYSDFPKVCSFIMCFCSSFKILKMFILGIYSGGN